jgi:acyl-coenzyme A synthetase/AMP-(fatty) acid ligase
VPGTTTYRTGDLVYRDENGLYVYLDRADRVVKRSGVRISLVELSESIRDFDGVEGVACVLFDDEGRLGIAAFVVCASSLTARELQDAARDVLPDTMLPNRIVIVEELPLTGSGKLDERRLLVDAGLEALRTGTAADTTGT